MEILELPVTALVAQWIEHQTSNLGVAGSSPAGGTFKQAKNIDLKSIMIYI